MCVCEYSGSKTQVNRIISPTVNMQKPVLKIFLHGKPACESLLEIKLSTENGSSMKQCNSMEGTQLGTRWVCVENGLFSFITTIAVKQNVNQGKELYKHEIDSGQGGFV